MFLDQLLPNIPQQLQPFLFYGLFIWSLVWKGFALWKAAKNEHKYWFIAILILNTMALVEIVYIFVFSDKKHPIYSYVEKLKVLLPFKV